MVNIGGENRETQSGGNGKALLIFFLVILFFVSMPMLISASLTYLVLFRIRKQKPSYSLFEISIVTLVLFGLFLLTKAHIYGLGIKMLGNIPIPYLAKASKGLVSFSVYSFFLGFYAGWVFMFYRWIRLKKDSSLTMEEGSWAYGFEYRHSPFDKLKERRLIRACKEGELFSKQAAPLGILDDKIVTKHKTVDKVDVVYSYYEEAYKTRFISGVTGSGKTITMLNMMYNDIKAGYPICVIDFKAGIDVAYFLSKWAKENDIPFYHFKNGRKGTYRNPFCREQASYDPIASGSPTSKVDLVLNLREWDSSSEVYKNRTKTILQVIFYLLDIAKAEQDELKCVSWDKGGIAQVLDLLEATNMFELINWLGKKIDNKLITGDNIKRQYSELVSFYRDLTGKNSPLLEQVNGLKSLLKTITLSDYADWLTKGSSSLHINLKDIALSNKPAIVLFQMSPNENPEFAKSMGSVIMYDIARVSKEKGEAGNLTPFGLYIDEFQTLNPDMVAGIAEKARSAKFFTTLSVQAADQVAKTATKNAEETLNSLFGTIETFVIHAGSIYDTAERFSKLIGKTTKNTYKTTRKRQGWLKSLLFKDLSKSVVTTEQTNDYIVMPESFQNLSSPNKANGYKAEAYYITKTPADPSVVKQFGTGNVIARKVWLIPWEGTLEEVPESFKEIWNNREVSYVNENISLIDDNFSITKEFDEESVQVVTEAGCNDIILKERELPKREMPPLSGFNSMGNKGIAMKNPKTSVDVGQKEINIPRKESPPPKIQTKPRRQTTFDKMKK